MISISAQTGNNAWKQALAKLRKEAPEQESRDQVTRELLHVSFTIADPRQRIVFARPINPAFAISEVLWILSGANDVSFLKYWNPRMKTYSDDEISFHGAYGFRLGHTPSFSAKVRENMYKANTFNVPRIDQIKQAYEALKHTAHSRQIVLQIWNSYTDLPNPYPRSKDIPCNLIAHLLLRDDKLEWLQVMRSNDLIWGTPYNFIQFTMLQEIMAGWLGVEVGSYNHISDSLHVYERHFQDLGKINTNPEDDPVNKADLRIASYEDWEIVWEKLVNHALQLHHTKTKEEILESFHTVTRDIPEGYKQLAAVLTAECLRKNKYGDEAMEIIEIAGDFWKKSWRQWADHTASEARIKKEPIKQTTYFKGNTSSPNKRFIVLEGPDGAGKSTFFELLSTYYNKKYPEIALYADSFPGKVTGTLGEYVYRIHHNTIDGAPDAKSMANPALQLLHVAAHVDTIQNRLIPTLAKPNGLVLLDRYWWSTYVYSRMHMSEDAVFRMLQSELLFWEAAPIKPIVFYIKRERTLKPEECNAGEFGMLNKYYEEIFEKESQAGIETHIIDNNRGIHDAFIDILSYVD